MDFYDGMLKKIETKKNECEKKRASVLGQVDKFKKEIQELKAKQNDAAAKSDVETFTKLDGEIKMREILLEKISADVDEQLKNNMVDISVVFGLRDEVTTYTNSQIETKYKKVQELVLSIVALIDDIETLDRKAWDVCDEVARFGEEYSTYDPEKTQGLFYHSHRMPDKIKEIKNESIGSMQSIVHNLLETETFVY